MQVPKLPGYEDLEPIGRGGAAVVYRARQLSMGGRDVAIKVINPVTLDDGGRLRFERECAAAGRLSWHPNVLSSYDAGMTPDNEPYLVMEYLPAGSYGDRVRGGEGLPPEKVARVGIEIADALQAAHAAGLVHRDVKPSNILVGARGTPVLADFGIALVTGLARSRTGTFNATITHAPPEVLDGARSDGLVDVYSLGSTLYTLAAGHAPFEDPDDDSLLGLVERISSKDVPPLPDGAVSAELDEVIRQAMAKDPADRWPTAAAMGEAITDLAR